MAPPKIKVLVLGSPLDYVDKEYVQEFEKDYVLDVLPAPDRATTKALLPKQIATAGPYQALVIKMGTLPYEPFDADLLGALVPHCRVIASASAGYNEFDVAWMTRAGIWFCNAAHGVTEATADMTIFLAIAAMRNTSVAERQAREGKWKTGLVPSGDVFGRTLGIVGLGAIGRRVAVKAHVFNLNVVYYNRHRLSESEEASLGVTYCPSLPSLLSVSDIISIHTPLAPQTINLISHAEFAMMKPGAVLVNTARGAVVDENAMIQALESGSLARAALDVFPNEPEIDEYLRNSDKVILQPHMAGLTDSAFAKSQTECLENVRALFERGVPNSPVNRPDGEEMGKGVGVR